MTTTEAIQQIIDRGHSTTEDTIRGMIRRNKLPKPRLDSSLRYDWTEADIDRVCEVLSRHAAHAAASRS